MLYSVGMKINVFAVVIYCVTWLKLISLLCIRVSHQETDLIIIQSNGQTQDTQMQYETANHIWQCVFCKSDDQTFGNDAVL